MTAVPIAFRSNPGKYNFLGVPELVNCYAEKLGPDGKGQLAIVPCAGLVTATTNGDTPGRGMIYLEDTDKLYCLHASALYRVTYDGSSFTSTRIGPVPGIDPVQLSRNQNASPQIVAHTDAGTYVIESDSVSLITDVDFPTGVVTAEYVGGYHFYGQETTTFYHSALNQAESVGALDYSTFERRAGKLVRIVENAGELVGFCSTWMEFWDKIRNPGADDFPFAPIGFKSRGLKAAHAVVASDNTLMFPGDDNNVYRLANYDPQVISTHEVARLIQNDASAEDIKGFPIDREGHAFAYWTGTDWTRGYDSATGTWHSRRSYGADKWRAQYAVRAWGKTLVQDRLSGKVFYLDEDTFTEDSGTMEWTAVSPPMHLFADGGIIDALHFDLATGYGTLSGQGSDPKVMLWVSKDGGTTYDQYRELSLATQGNYQARVTARRLGKVGPKGAVIKLSITDPVVRSLVNMDAEVRRLKR